MKISKVPLPEAKGCFTADYPRLAWRGSACAEAPSIPMIPKVPGPIPTIVGNGNHIVTQTPGGPISQAFGTFENVTGLSSVSSPINNVGPPVANAYTLQLNTNFFPTPACAGAAIPALCTGWQQFIFANDGSNGALYIQYWLLVYNNPCPAGWTSTIILGDTYCSKNSPAAVVAGNTPITLISSFELTGDVTGAVDLATMKIGASVYATADTNIVDATGNWIMAEFNVFGYGGGGMATFNATASAHVRTRINYGAMPAPICQAIGFTAETNNLNFGLPQPPSTPGTPAGPNLVFLENLPGGAAANCDAANTWGDTHQVTFGGLLYDFQATGDFVEAQVGTNFEVQSRKVSGAPTWPNTSLNRSIATRMGSTKVAVCDGTRLVVNGTTASVAPGGTLWIPAGVTIHRTSSNVYVIRDNSGNSVKVTANSGYNNLDVGLGTFPVTVRGLLGNPANNPNQLEAKDGTKYTVPLSFSDLYNKFGASWRVSPATSLLNQCNTVASGNPSAPFFSSNLNPTVRTQAENACRQAGVKQVWLDTCALDAAVIGPEAAAAFVKMEPPLVNGNRPGSQS
ncbi:hypothetical protein F4553_000614 [Allocatelliglobosispora scoriae]|uniref:VWFD domain-containing protein n=1 Tax=Allocatelliglobosispora scoriae TaxID=643052 RepID=A0A841BHY5_9ACTN|nr:VWD domain-containing protein [Allocatelliglobosispora scoriae]MBB5867235.1 hypothetical protein [Allocatelliglobosispora scoriae]